MTAEHAGTAGLSISDWLALMPEAAVVTRADGRIVEFNARFAQMADRTSLDGAMLGDLAVCDERDLQEHLRIWARSKQPVPGALSFRGTSGVERVAVEGGRLSPAGSGEGQPLLLLRLHPQSTAIKRFRALSEQVEQLTREIARRHDAEEAVRSQREWWRTTLSSIGDAVIATDTQGRVVFMNPVAEALTGWTDDDAHDVDISRVFHIVNQESRRAVESPVAHVLREGNIVGLANHTVLIARDGTERPIDDSGAPIMGSDGRLAGVVLVFRDISERYRQEGALKRSHDLLNAVIEGTEDSIFVKDLDGRYLTINQAGADVLGAPPEQIVGRTDEELLPQETAERLTAWDQRVISSGKSETFEEIFEGDGQARVMMTNKAPYRDTDGRVIGVIGVSRDITRRKRDEQALREHEERQRFILNAARVGTWQWEISTNEVRWSENMEALHGLAPGQFDGRFESYLDLIHPEDRPKLIETINHVLESGEQYHIEYRERRPDGALIWIEAKGRLVCDVDGRPVRLVGTCADVTPRKKAERLARSLADAGAILSESLDYETTLASVADLLVPEWADWCAVDLLDDSGQIRNVAVAHVDPAKVELAREMRRRHPPRLDDPAGAGSVISSGEPMCIPEVTDDLIKTVAKDDWHLQTLRDLGLRSGVVVPLICRDRTLGAITLVSAETPHRFTDADIPDVREIARRCALAVDNARLYRDAQRELEQRKQIEGILRDSEAEARSRAEELEALMESVPAVVFIAHDREGEHITGNQAAYNLLRQPRGANLSKTAPEPDRPGNFRLFHDGAEYKGPDLPVQRAARGEEVYGEEMELRFDNGDVAHMFCNAVPLFDPHGEPRGAIAVFVDITERKEAERDMARLAAIVNNSEDVIISKTLDGIIESFNPAAERMYGYRAEEVIGKPISILMPEEYESEFPEFMQRLRRGERIENYETVRRRNDGTLIDVSVTISPTRRADGTLIGASAIARDITERKEAEKALRESESRFRTMADAAPVFIWMTDETGACAYVNRQWLEFTGRTIAEELGDGWSDSIHADDRTRCLRDFSQAIEDRRPVHLEYRLRRADGAYRWVLDYGVPRFEPDGTFVGFIGSCVDINDRYEAEQQILAMNETLEHRVARRTRQLRALARQLARAEQEERRRLARILHDDLQQLLVAAGMRTEMFAQRVGDPDTAALARQVRDLIGHSIDSSRLLTKELSPPVLYEQGICATLPWLADTMRERHGLAVSIELGEDAEPHDEEARVTFFLAARELLFNVVKHSGVDRANLTLSRTDAGRVRLTVEDQGGGFDVTEIEQSQDRSAFGLFDLRERAEFFGGRVSIDSTTGGGTRICFELPDQARGDADRIELPIESRDLAAAAPARPRDRSRLRVLLADDHQIVREGIAGILAEHVDIEVVAEAENGQQAIALAHEHQPDVIIMDTTMPNLNGIEATQRLTRQLPQIAVVGLSMHDNPDMARAMREAGAIKVLVKDGPSDALIEAVRDAVAADRR